MAPTHTPVSKPIAAAHLLMDWYPSHTWDDIKSQWSNIRFDAVNVLNVAAFRVQTDGKTFVLDNSDPGKVDLLKWLVATARAQNSNIKILAQQWWSPDPIPNTAWVSLDKTQINTYAASVAGVVKLYELDGYDVDYETGNEIAEAPTILAAVRAELDALSKKENRPLYLTISPASTAYLIPETNPAAKIHPVSKSVDWVNIQTYSGGSNSNNTVEKWLKLGFSNAQLLYGILPETTDGSDGKSPTIPEVERAYKSHNLGGINLWRLTSGNYIFESQVQVLLYNFLHKTTLPLSPNPTEVENLWNAGREAQKALKQVA